jgi:hypothetical protein
MRYLSILMTSTAAALVLLLAAIVTTIEQMAYQCTIVHILGDGTGMYSYCIVPEILWGDAP